MIDSFFYLSISKTTWEKVATSPRPQMDEAKRRGPRAGEGSRTDRQRQVGGSVAAGRPAVATATTSGAFFTRPGGIDSEGATIHLHAVHGADCGLSLGVSAHGDEREAAGAASGAIHHEVGLEDGAVGGESVLQVIFGGVEGNVSNKQFVIHYCDVLYFINSPWLPRVFPTIGFRIITERTKFT